MSWFTNAVHTFVGWFEKEITALEKNAPAIERTVEAAAKYATGILTIVGSQVEPGSDAGKIISTALSDVKVASAVVYDAGAHPSVASMFQGIASNLGGLETATGIKNPASVATVGKVVSTLSALASVFLTLTPAA
jgi:hypothetical protein